MGRKQAPWKAYGLEWRPIAGMDAHARGLAPACQGHDFDWLARTSGPVHWTAYAPNGEGRDVLGVAKSPHTVELEAWEALTSRNWYGLGEPPRVVVPAAYEQPRVLGFPPAQIRCSGGLPTPHGATVRMRVYPQASFRPTRLHLLGHGLHHLRVLDLSVEREALSALGESWFIEENGLSGLAFEPGNPIDLSALGVVRPSGWVQLFVASTASSAQVHAYLVGYEQLATSGDEKGTP